MRRTRCECAAGWTGPKMITRSAWVANQLRAHLQIVVPAAASLFADIDSDISLRFLERFATQTLRLRRRLPPREPLGRPALSTSPATEASSAIAFTVGSSLPIVAILLPPAGAR